MSLLKGVLRRLPELLVIASRRSPKAYLATETRTGDEGAFEINLGQLPAEAVAEIVRRRLRVGRLSPALETFVQTRTSGNPFYSEEIVSALRDAGAISVEHGVGGFRADAMSSAKVPLPASLESAIVARIDALPTEEQLLLKAASVVGGSFKTELLANVYPRELHADDIRAMLDSLVGRELLRSVGTRASPEYEFRHVISEEVTYSLLPFAQRRALHAAIATALEENHAGHLEPLYGQLARHWERAEEKSRAIDYLERAAEQALRSYANHDAIRYVKRAFELSASVGDGSESLSRWETLLGDAYNELADYSQSSPHYERALTLSGQRVAHNSFERTRGLVAHIAEQAWLRLAPTSLFKGKQPEREVSRRVAHIRERLAERHFFRNESIGVLDETLAAVNFAERGGAVAEMISGYSALAIGMGMSGLTRPARFYRDRAMSLGERFEPTPEAARAYLLAAVLEYGLGGWDASEQFAQRSLSLYRQLGDRGRAQTVLTIMWSCRILRGELEAADVLQRHASEDVEAETLQGKVWRLAAKSIVATIRGRAQAEDLEELSEVGDAELAGADELFCFGTVAAGHLQRAEIAKAVSAADRGFGLLRKTDIVWGNYIYGASGVIEVYLACWSAANAGDDYRSKALLACDSVRRATRNSPVCRPRSLLLSGRAAFLSGKTARARHLWTQALAQADRFGLRREAGLALYEIGRAAEPGDPSGHSNLSRAVKALEAIGAEPDLAMARLALSSRPSALERQ